MDSLVCKKYARKIGNEVGWLEKIVQLGIETFNAGSNPVYKELIEDLNLQTERSVREMQVIYLVNLIEAFMQDFISEKDSLSEQQTCKPNFWRDYLRAETDLWDKYCSNEIKPINSSRSFMNITYSLFIIEKKYGIKYPSYLTPLVYELGSLRNCLVHHDGELNHKDKGVYNFTDTLSQTISFLNIDISSNKLIDLNRNGYLNKVIYDLQTFVELCGGIINRPIDHSKETE